MDRFESRQWSLVVAAGSDDSIAARDLTQGFLLSLLERRDFETLSPERGRLGRSCGR